MNTIGAVTGAVAAKKVSAREIAADYFKRIAARNGELNAYLTLCEERAYRQADRVDALLAAGKPLGPLAGVPIAVKDVISTRGDSDYLRLEDPGRLCAAVRCDGRHPAGSGGGSDSG